MWRRACCGAAHVLLPSGAPLHCRPRASCAKVQASLRDDALKGAAAAGLSALLLAGVRRALWHRLLKVPARLLQYHCTDLQCSPLHWHQHGPPPAAYRTNRTSCPATPTRPQPAFAGEGRLTFDELQTKSYMELKGTGLAHTCPTLRCVGVGGCGKQGGQQEGQLCCAPAALQLLCPGCGRSAAGVWALAPSACLDGSASVAAVCRTVRF